MSKGRPFFYDEIREALFWHGGNTMKKQRKARDPEHIGFKECFGTTTLSFTNALTGVLMSSMLMVYITEYSGIS